MSINRTPQPDPGEFRVYQIRLQGHLSSQWAAWFGEMAVTLEDNGDTLLTGPVVDQSALYGLLKKVRDLGLPLLSVNCVAQDQAEASTDKPSGPIQ